MTARELINTQILPLQLSDSPQSAIALMVELKTDILPVVDQEEFKGFINESTILADENLNKKIAEFTLEGGNNIIDDNQHFYDILRALSENKQELIAVTDNQNKYLGVVSITDTLLSFSETLTVQDQGSVIVLSIRKLDYSIEEIGRLIEDNNAKIIGLYTVPNPKDDMMMELVLKLNTNEITAILATFERFEYTILGNFNKAAQASYDEDERLEHLLKYLNMLQKPMKFI